MLKPSGLSSASSLASWLSWQEQCHKQEIDLGLARVAEVHQRLLSSNESTPYTITIAGTNGKGSSVALLESILLAAGYKVGSYMTPHLIHYNERIRINGESAEDNLITASFEAIDKAREGVSLSYFEFGTLAALDIFAKQKVDIQLLEVGLGGRLDAVNIIDADAALVTSIDLDHIDWLGNDVAKIALEKAGIFRAHQKAVCSDQSVPSSLLNYAKELNTNLLVAGKDFNLSKNQNDWQLIADHRYAGNYPNPIFKGLHQLANAAGVVTLLAHIREAIPVTKADIDNGLTHARLQGRTQHVSDRPIVILDVAHNAESAKALADYLQSLNHTGSIHAVFSILADKDMHAVLMPFMEKVNHWYIAPLEAQRAEEISVIQKNLESIDDTQVFESIKDAFLQAKNNADKNDLIVCFGSFYLVEACLREL